MSKLYPQPSARHNPPKSGCAIPAAHFGRIWSVKLAAFILSVLCCAGLFGDAATNGLIRTTAELRRLADAPRGPLRHFVLNGTVVCNGGGGRNNFVIADETGGISIHNDIGISVAPGDIVRVRGGANPDKNRKLWTGVAGIDVLRHEQAPPVIETTVSDILEGKCDYRVARVSGRVVDEFQDDIDLDFHIILLSSGTAVLPVSFPASDRSELSRLLNAHITVRGICLPDMGDRRIFHGHGLTARLSDVSLDSPAPADPFDVQKLEILHHTDASHVLGLARRRVDGWVMAAWRGDRFLLATDDERKVVATVSGDTGLPVCGQRISVVGLPDTDLFNINLSGARWRPLNDGGSAPAEERISADDLLNGHGPKRRIDPINHGKTVSLVAIVRSVPRSDFVHARLYVEIDGHVLPVDVSACPNAVRDLDVGCRISLTCVCLLESESVRPNAQFPRVKGFMLVLRDANDLQILSLPSWWTAGRLLAVIGILAAMLLVILVWNVLLRRLSERRGRELAASAIAKAESDLKVFERTRLAVELHDSVAQNLTGASLALRGKKYELAAKTLDSCREDLRNCLWDLRNLTLDDGDINAAIRKTLEPHVGEATLTIRFSVPRERLTDKTAHTILRILRELATNAVRHGGATSVKVAGSIEGDRLLFSVKDNGCGFDPDAAPGMEQGHFGLQGIRDRIDALEGDVEINSACGMGTKVTVSLHVPQERNEVRP